MKNLYVYKLNNKKLKGEIKMKKILAILIVLSVALSLVGCSSSPNDYDSHYEEENMVVEEYIYEDVIVEDSDSPRNNSGNNNINNSGGNKNNYNNGGSNTNNNTNNAQNNSNSNNTVHEHVYSNGKCFCGLKETILYSDSYVQITFKSAKKGYSADEVELYFYVKNKSSRQLLIQADAVSLNGYTFNNLSMSDEVSPNSIGTIDLTVNEFDHSLVNINSINSIGGQFRIIDDNNWDNIYDAVFKNIKLDGSGTSGLPTNFSKNHMVFTDNSCSIYYVGAGKGYSSDEVKLYFYVENKTSYTLLFQADVITLNGYSFSNLTMSDPILSNTVGKIDLTVNEFDYNLVNISSINSIGGQFRVIDDANWDNSYDANLSSSNPSSSSSNSNSNSSSTTSSSTSQSDSNDNDNSKWSYAEVQKLDGYMEDACKYLEKAKENCGKGSAFYVVANRYIQSADDEIKRAISMIESKSDITFSNGTSLLSECKDLHTALSALDGVSITTNNVDEYSDQIKTISYNQATDAASIKILTGKLLLEF